MKTLIAGIIIVVLTVIIIRGFYNIFFEIPESLRRIADALEKMSETKPSNISNNVSTNAVVTKSSNDGNDQEFLI